MNINIGPLLLNRKDYHKNETFSGNNFKFQHEFFSTFFIAYCTKNIGPNLNFLSNLKADWFGYAQYFRLSAV